jgi:hypothetical protein
MEFTREKHKNFYINKMYEYNTYDAYIFVSYEYAKIKGWCCNAILFGYSFLLDIFYNHTLAFFVPALAESLLRGFSIIFFHGVHCQDLNSGLPNSI